MRELESNASELAVQHRGCHRNRFYIQDLGVQLKVGGCHAACLRSQSRLVSPQGFFPVFTFESGWVPPQIETTEPPDPVCKNFFYTLLVVSLVEPKKYFGAYFDCWWLLLLWPLLLLVVVVIPAHPSVWPFSC